MRDRFNRFMTGRYGIDELSKFTLAAAVVLMVINMFARASALNVLIVALLVWIYFRMFSTNTSARWAENSKYLDLKDRFTGFFRKQEKDARGLKEYHIYRCPNCGQKIRVPRGKGRIMITCPKCRKEFIKKS